MVSVDVLLSPGSISKKFFAFKGLALKHTGMSLPTNINFSYTDFGMYFTTILRTFLVIHPKNFFNIENFYLKQLDQQGSTFIKQ